MWCSLPAESKHFPWGDIFVFSIAAIALHSWSSNISGYVSSGLTSQPLRNASFSFSFVHPLFIWFIFSRTTGSHYVFTWQHPCKKKPRCQRRLKPLYFLFSCSTNSLSRPFSPDFSKAEWRVLLATASRKAQRMQELAGPERQYLHPLSKPLNV